MKEELESTSRWGRWGDDTRAIGAVALAEAVGIHQPGAHANGQGRAREQVFVLAAAAVVVEVLVRQAQVRQIALPKGRTIGAVPEGRQVKALADPLHGPAELTL